MQRLIECVPNFSEGRDPAVLDAIAAAIRKVEGVQLLDVDPGADTNRTVFTFVGEPDPVIEAAFQAIKTAAATIDMRRHSGAHPRIGATDVCPLIPIEGIEAGEAVRYAEALGERVARELQIPVYLYEYAARSEVRRNLANIRSGEYEGLARKMADPEWQPDFSAPYNARSGATVIGVRDFLIAYNVNLNTTDKRLAHDVALSIREAGRAKRDENGEIVRNADGTAAKVPGLLPHVKAVGWYIETYRQAQVSINLTSYKSTPPHVVFDVVRAEAEKRGLIVTGSELVGLIPLEAMKMAGRHYLMKQGRNPGVPEEILVETAIRSLGLDQLSDFDPHQKIIEYRFRKPGPLASMSLREFANLLSTDAPAPGGGSTAALGASLAASLAAMVASLTANSPSPATRRGLTEAFHEMSAVAERAQALKDAALQAIDRDTDAFNEMMSAMRLKVSTPEEQRIKDAAVAAAIRGAIEVPFSVLEASKEIAVLARTVALKGMKASASDGGVAGAMALAAAQGAYYNVLINLNEVTDPVWRDETADRAKRVLDEVRAIAHEIETLMEQSLAPTPVAVN
ncbi:MAG: glutamate formimidoyltransferase [Armatimonadetes bacterium]|nr:glutamate formimidoyltransferase [Armatimonadota bacterium]